tara:strand:+ start:1499 stop:1774 length:276 start_codon:yes stop_codon:yes gene_type:complete
MTTTLKKECEHLTVRIRKISILTDQSFIGIGQCEDHECMYPQVVIGSNYNLLNTFLLEDDKEISIKDEGYPLEKIWVRYQKNKTTSSLSQS